MKEDLKEILKLVEKLRERNEENENSMQLEVRLNALKEIVGHLLEDLPPGKE